MKIRKEYLSRQIKNIIEEHVALELVNAELAKTSVTNSDLFKDPDIIMEKFNSIFEVAGIIFDNQKLLEGKITALEAKIDALELNLN